MDKRKIKYIMGNILDCKFYHFSDIDLESCLIKGFKASLRLADNQYRKEIYYEKKVYRTKK